MGIYKYPRIKMYWNSHASIPLITESMSLKRFYQLRSCIHFTTNENKNPNDHFWKVRPLYEAVRQGCLKVERGESLSVDEQMIPYRGDLNVNQYIKGKPTPWGVKVYPICDSAGIMYDFIIYQGKTTEFNSECLLFGQGAAGVMQLCENIVLPGNELFFYNYFSTFSLFEWLKNKVINAAGTVRLNRFHDPPLTSDKVMKKKNSLGDIPKLWHAKILELF